MKKYIAIAALLAAGSAFANAITATNAGSNGTITLDGTQATDARLDFTYNTTTTQTLTTTVDSVTIYGTDGYGMGTGDVSLVFNIQDTLTATNNIKLVSTGASSTWTVNTNLDAEELSLFNSEKFVSRWVVTADIIENIAAYIANDHIDVSLGNVNGLKDGGIVFCLNSNYYASSDITFDSNYATINAGAQALTLEEGVLYTVAKITADNGASVKGIGFVAAIPEPSTFGLLAGLGALALVGTRRRRK
ncbi:MAG: PEP-CTERM sorting domain-containing protein [Opitutales bacterium]|nr:PEP-CTERM sorting domain-containing protein [Opitutales bacterium]